MLVLSRKLYETLIVDGPCVIKICRIGDRNVRIGIDAGRDVNVRRGELAGPDETLNHEPDERTRAHAKK